MTAQPPSDTDESRKTTCYRCACRCGIDVPLRAGKLRTIEGNRDHPVNRGVICARGAAGIQQVTAPARLRAPLKRVGPRGARIVSVNPVRTGCNAVADDWLGLTPGTDGLLILALVHELLVAGRIDLDDLARFTDRDVRPFQSVLCDLGARLGLPGFVTADGSAHRRGASNPAQLERYIENGGVFQAEIPPEAPFFKPWNRAWQEWAVSMGLQDKPLPYLFSLWCEPLRRFQLAAEGHGPHPPPDHLRLPLLAALASLVGAGDLSGLRRGGGAFAGGRGFRRAADARGAEGAKETFCPNARRDRR